MNKAFLDESRPNAGRHGSVAVVTVDGDIVDEVEARVRAALGELRELKFNETGDGRQKRAALRVVDIVKEYADRGKLRIDTLSWDKSDTRNAIADRHDYKNIGRMLHHLLKNALGKWPDGTQWTLVPDEQDQLDYKTVANTVNAVLKARAGNGDASEILFVGVAHSHESPLVQIADLFAGIAGYLRDLMDEIAKQQSRSTRARNDIIVQLLPWIQSHGVVGYRKGEGIFTARSSPVNIWPYRPQGNYDRAPVKNEDECEEIVVTCTAEDCDELLIALRRWKKPLCAKHYGEMVQESDDADKRARQEEKQRTSSHYCGICAVMCRAEDARKRLNNRTYEDELLCPKCGEVLTEINPLPQRTEPVREENRCVRELRRPDVRLPRPNRREDDD